MGRRRGSDKLFNNKKEAQKKSSFKREHDRLNKTPDIIISCEDSVSAPTYFKMIVDNLISEKLITQDSFIIVPHDGGTQPSKVLDRLLKHKDKLTQKTYKDFTHKWIVIDRDIERTNGGGHTKEDFNNAINNASQKNIEVAYANDSFELWYLLHFNYENTSILRDDINTKLITLLKNKEPYKFSKLTKNNMKDANYTKLIFNVLKELQEKAIKNAQRLLESYGDEHSPEKDNPSTTIHKLVRILNQLNRTKSID